MVTLRQRHWISSILLRLLTASRILPQDSTTKVWVTWLPFCRTRWKRLCSVRCANNHYLFFKDLRLCFESHICQQQVILIDLLTFSCAVVISMILCQIFLKTVPCLIVQKDCVFIGNNKINFIHNNQI